MTSRSTPRTMHAAARSSTTRAVVEASNGVPPQRHRRRRAGGRGGVLRRDRRDALGPVAGRGRRQRWRSGRLQRRRPHLVHHHVRGGDRVGERPAHRGRRQRHRAGHRRRGAAAAGVGARHPHGHRGRPRPAHGRRAVGLRGRASPPIVGDGPPRPATLVLVAPSLVLAITANLFAQHAVAADRVLDPRRRVDLVPLHEGGVHPRRDDHPARAAARRVAALRAAPAVPGHGLRAGAPGRGSGSRALEQLWIGVLASAQARFRTGERRLQVVGG